MNYIVCACAQARRQISRFGGWQNKLFRGIDCFMFKTNFFGHNKFGGHRPQGYGSACTNQVLPSALSYNVQPPQTTDPGKQLLVWW